MLSTGGGVGVELPNRVRLTQTARITVESQEKGLELGIVVDVAHMTQVCFWETLEISQAPVIMSHASAQRFFPYKPEDSPLHTVRDVSRGPERLEALARNGGVFGVFFLNRGDVDGVE